MQSFFDRMKSWLDILEKGWKLTKNNAFIYITRLPP